MDRARAKRSHRQSKSWWRTPSRGLCLAGFCALIAVGLTSLLPSADLLSSLLLPLHHISVLLSLHWHRLQWSIFTQGKVRLQVNHQLFNISDFHSSPESSIIQRVVWDISVVEDLIEEGDDVTQSFFITNVAASGKPALIQQGPAAQWELRNWDILSQITSGKDMVLEGVRWQKNPLHLLNRERDKGGMLGHAQGEIGETTLYGVNLDAQSE